jgi:hypothetical protein
LAATKLFADLTHRKVDPHLRHSLDAAFQVYRSDGEFTLDGQDMSQRAIRGLKRDRFPRPSLQEKLLGIVQRDRPGLTAAQRLASPFPRTMPSAVDAAGKGNYAKTFDNHP